MESRGGISFYTSPWKAASGHVQEITDQAESRGVIVGEADEMRETEEQKEWNVEGSWDSTVIRSHRPWREGGGWGQVDRAQFSKNK